MIRISDYIVYDDDGNAVKEWYSIASYLDETGDTIDAVYRKPDGWKHIYSSWNPGDLLRNPNKIIYGLVGTMVLVIMLLVLI